MAHTTSEGNIYSDTLLAFDRRLQDLQHIENFWYFLSSQTQRFRASQVPDSICHRLADEEYQRAHAKWVDAIHSKMAIKEQIQIYNDLDKALKQVQTPDPVK